MRPFAGWPTIPNGLCPGSQSRFHCVRLWDGRSQCCSRSLPGTSSHPRFCAVSPECPLQSGRFSEILRAHLRHGRHFVRKSCDPSLLHCPLLRARARCVGGSQTRPDRRPWWVGLIRGERLITCPVLRAPRHPVLPDSVWLSAWSLLSALPARPLLPTLQICAKNSSSLDRGRQG
jgi:hypothetical protein